MFLTVVPHMGAHWLSLPTRSKLGTLCHLAATLKGHKTTSILATHKHRGCRPVSLHFPITMQPHSPMSNICKAWPGRPQVGDHCV
jgi:hypothetical protein